MAVAHDALPVAPEERSVLAHRPATLLWLWVLFWLLMVTVSVGEQFRNPNVSWWEPILWEGSSAVVGSCWMFVAVRASNHFARYLDRPLAWLGHHLLWLPLVDVTFLPAIYAIRHGVYALVGRPYHHAPWPFLACYETLKVVLFATLWLGILFGFDSYAQWQRQRRQLLELQKALAEAQLARLQGQLRPHFFFNALNTISALMQVDVARADRLVAGLGDLLHISLRSSDAEMTSLREELRSLELYAQIMQERFTDRVSVAWRVDPAVMTRPVPTLILQPLLENAFKHGVERSTVPVRIEVSADAAGDALSLLVSNTGPALAPDYREGVGLRNCRERLRVIYGERAALHIRDEPGAVTAQILIPLAASTA